MCVLCRRGYGNEVIEFSGPDDSITDPSRSKNVVIQYTAYDEFKGRGKTEVVNSPLGFLGAEALKQLGWANWFAAHRRLSCKVSSRTSMPLTRPRRVSA